MRKVAADPDLQKRFEAAGAHCLASTPEEATAFAAKERALWKDVVALSGAKME
jgi:tripartite-type tricarboxylate transporter receptor subunit TctC